MTRRSSTSVPPLAAPSPAAKSPSRFRPLRVVGVLPVVLALWFAAVAARAALTSTNFPAAVSNGYNGVITLQISGLPFGVSNVLVQKYIDANTNGIIDSGDLLVQQFQLTVGQASVFTNLNTSTPVTLTNFLPGCITSVTGQITAPLNFQNGDFAQNLAGQYLYKISCPGQSVTITNLFVVTNSFYSSCLTGAVEDALSPFTNIPNALVLLCNAGQNGALNVQAGAVANNSGYFTIRAPPGSYNLIAAKSNFVDNVSSSGYTLYANQTNGNGLPIIDLTPATTNIAGRIADASTGSGLPGISGFAASTNSLLSLYFTDTNGNFLAPVTGTNVWQVPVNPFAAAFQSHFVSQATPIFYLTNNTARFTNALPPATTVFYGVVSNSSTVPAIPMPGVYLYANDNAGHQAFGQTVQNGQYAVFAGTNQWSLSIVATNYPLLTNDVFSPGIVQTNFTATNQACQQNFTLTYAPYLISGTVESLNGNPIAGVQVFASSTNAQAFSVYTSASGSYSLNVSPGTWTVGVSSNSLASLGYYNFPTNQIVTISSASATGINFYILVCGEIAILTTNLPDAMVGSYYDTSLQAESCQDITNWTTAYGITLTPLSLQATNTCPSGTAIYSDSQLIGYLQSYFSFGLNGNNPFNTNITCTWDQTTSDGGFFLNLSASINLTGPITNQMGIQFGGVGTVWTAQPTTQNGSTYTTTLTLSKYPVGSTPWDVNGQLQAYTVTSGMLMTATSGSPSNTVATTLGILPPLTNGNPLTLASTIPYTSSNNTVVWVQTPLGPNQYLISAYGPQQTNVLPSDITLYPDGSLMGTPAATGTNHTYNFTVAAEDASSDTAVQPLSLFVYPLTTLSNGTNSSAQAARMVRLSSTFPMQINGVIAGPSYTVLMATNLTSGGWVPIYTTNAATTNALVVPDSSATNPARFYRVLITP